MCCMMQGFIFRLEIYRFFPNFLDEEKKSPVSRLAHCHIGFKIRAYAFLKQFIVFSKREIVIYNYSWEQYVIRCVVAWDI